MDGKSNELSEVETGATASLSLSLSLPFPSLQSVKIPMSVLSLTSIQADT